MKHLSRISLAILIVLCAFSFFVGLGYQPIGDSDEAFYAEAAREMVELGDWLTPRYNYEYRFQKPILFYWLVASTYSIVGVTAWAARLWSAMAAVGLVALAYAAARRWYDERTAFMAAAIVATNFGYFSIARMSLPDLPLAFFMSVAVWLGLRYLEDGSRTTLAGAAAAAALGFLTKGPVAVAVPGLVLLVTWAVAFRRRLPVADLFLVVGVLAAVAAPWYLAMLAEHGWGYFDRFFVGDNLERFTTSRFNGPRPVWYYVPIVFGGMLPWSPFLILVVPLVVATIRGHRPWQRTDLVLLAWMVMPFLFFTLSVGKQPRYILIVLPPLAIATARAIRRAMAAPARPRLFSTSAGLAAGSLLVLGVLLWRARPLLEPINPFPLVLVALMVGAAGLIVLWWSQSTRWRQTPAALALASAIALPLTQLGALAPAGKTPVERIAAMISSGDATDSRNGSHESAVYQVFVRNMVFYTRTKQIELANDNDVAAFLSRNRPAVCVLKEEDLERIERTTGVRPLRLAETAYFNPAGLKLGTLLAAHPATDLDHAVVVVTNKAFAASRGVIGLTGNGNGKP